MPKTRKEATPCILHPAATAPLKAFHVVYENKDELGQLCKEFENMRKQLEENNRAVWHMMEEEKALRAAIAHDIRSPLSVLKGYQEMLLEFVPEDTLDKAQLLSMLEKGMEQIERMNGFVETMRQMSSLEQRTIHAENIQLLRRTRATSSYDLEDKILKYYPKQVKEYEEYIEGYSQDVKLAGQHQAVGEEKFCPMTLKGVVYTEKTDAGEMLLTVCKENPLSAPVEIGSYRGFRMEVYYDTLNAHYCLNLCGKMKHTVSLGTDALGNLTRIENEIAKFPARLDDAKTKKAETLEQIENAKAEFAKPFPYEAELKEKTERLNALNIELNLDEKDTPVMDAEPEQSEEQPEKRSPARVR